MLSRLQELDLIRFRSFQEVLFIHLIQDLPLSGSKGMHLSNMLFLPLSRYGLSNLPRVGLNGPSATVLLDSSLVERVSLVQYKASTMVCF